MLKCKVHDHIFRYLSFQTLNVELKFHLDPTEKLNFLLSFEEFLYSFQNEPCSEASMKMCLESTEKLKEA